jgi:hypothetical protein
MISCPMFDKCWKKITDEVTFVDKEKAEVGTMIEEVARELRKYATRSFPPSPKYETFILAVNMFEHRLLEVLKE